MGIYNPLYNEETGWAALDQLTPAQQALMNPAPFGGGYGMDIGAANNPTNIYGQFTGYQGGSQLPSGYDPYAVSNGVAGMNFQFPSGSNLGGGGNNWITENFITPANTVSPSNTLTPASTPATTTPARTTSGGTSTPAPVIASPALATNMGMQGAENVGGVGMYTGSNGPLNMSLFAPNGADAAIMQGSMGGLGEMLYKAAQQGGLNPNTSYLGFIDDLSRRALAAKGGQGGLLPQDFVNYMNSQAGQQWFQGMRTPAPGTPTGSPVIQQTGPQNPPVAPLPSQQVRPPGSGANSLITGGPDYGGPQVDPVQGYQIGNQPGGRDFIADMRAQLDARRQADSQREQQRLAGIQGAMRTPNPYQEQYTQQLNQRLSQLGLRMVPSSGMRTQEFRADPLGLGIDTRDIAMADGSPVDWNRLVAQYGRNAFSGWGNDLQQQSQDFYNNLISPYYQNTGELRPGGQQTPVIGSPGMMGQGSPGQNGWNPQPASQPNWNDLTDYGRQQMGMPTAAQWEQMRGTQSPMTIASYGPPQTTGGGNPSDYRAATYGTQPQTPAPAGGSGGSSSIPNTTNPLNPLTSQTQYRAPGFGSATNRLAGFGNTSLFGTPYGSGGSTGFGGTNPSQYRGAGMYGRAASYGQSQRPY